MVEIQCLACEKAIKPQQLNDTDNYDTENYDGQVVCQECKSLLYVKLAKGKVQKSKIVEKKFGELLEAGTVVKLFQLMEERRKQLEGDKFNESQREAKPLFNKILNTKP